MNTTAIIMMIVAMVVLWGGLALAIVHLVRHDSASPEDVRRDL